MFGEQAKADQQVSLAAAHGLLEVENRLRRGAREPRDPFADQVLHAMRDEGFLEKLAPVAFRGDQLVQLFDLVAELDRDRVGLEFAGVADGFQGWRAMLRVVGRKCAMSRLKPSRIYHWFRADHGNRFQVVMGVPGIRRAACENQAVEKLAVIGACRRLERVGQGSGSRGQADVGYESDGNSMRSKIHVNRYFIKSINCQK